MATRHEWTVKLHPDAEKELKDLPDDVRMNAIEELDSMRDGAGSSGSSWSPIRKRSEKTYAGYDAEDV